MTTKQTRTEILLKTFKGNPDEFNMLKGVMCCDHNQEYADSKRMREFFDFILIARRMDEINKDFLKSLETATKPKE